MGRDAARTGRLHARQAAACDRGRALKKSLSPLVSRGATAGNQRAAPGRESAGPATATALDWPRTFAARGARPLARAHLRHKAERAGAATLHCFVLDCSASMLVHGQLARAKGLLAVWLQAAYRRRDDVALLCFAAGRHDWRLRPGRAGPGYDPWVRPIGGGGGTSLGQGLAEADGLLATVARRQPHQTRCLWLLTDGRSPEQPPPPRWAHAVHVVDFEVSRVPLGRNATLAARWGATWWPAPPDQA